jgi:hypothetical protein
MRSAFIEVRAIREDLNARRQRGEQPDDKSYEAALYRWQDAIAAFAEGLSSRQSPLLAADSPPVVKSQLAELETGSIPTTVACYRTGPDISSPR